MGALPVSNTDRDSLILLDSLLDQALGYGVEDTTPTIFIAGQVGYLTPPKLSPDQKKKAREFGTALAAAMMAAGISGGGGGGGGSVTLVNTGAGLTGGPITTIGTISIASGGVTNAMLANPSLTVTAGFGLTSGGSVSLGGSVTIAIDTTVVATTTNVLTMADKTLTAPVIASGLTATGAGSNDFSGSTGTFETSTGAVSLAGSTTVLTGKTFSIADMTMGSVPFFGASGLMSQDNANLFWDAARARLGVGTNTPGFTGGVADVPGCRLQVQNSTTHSILLVESDAAASDAGILLATQTLGQDFSLFLDESDGQKVKFATSNGTGGMNNHSDRTAGTRMTLLQSGSLGIGTTGPLNKLDVNGGVAIGTYAGATTAPSNGMIVSGQFAAGVSSLPNTGVAGKFANNSSSSGTLYLQNTNGSGVSQLELYDNSGGFHTALGYANAGGGGYIYNQSGDPFSIQMNGNHAIHISSSSLVGININATIANNISVNGNASVGNSYTNTAAPSNGMIVQGSVGIGATNSTQLSEAKLVVSKDVTWPNDTISSQLSVCGATDVTKKMAIGMDSSTTHGFGFIAAGHEGVQWDNLHLQPSGGFVGIGTSSTAPSAALEVRSSISAASTAIIRNTNAAGFSTIVFQDSGGTERGALGYANASVSGTPAAYTSQLYLGAPGNLVFLNYTSTATRYGTFWGSSNNLSIGSTTSDPGIRLDVQASASAAAILRLTNLSASGYTANEWYDSSSTFQASVGWGNASVGVTFLRNLLYFYSGTAKDWVFTNTTDVKLQFGMTDSQTFIEFNNGHSAAVSAANKGRIIYDATPQLYKISKNAGAYEQLYSGNRSNVSEFQVTTTSPTTVATLTPPAQGNYIVYVYYRVTTATTTVTLSLTWTDSTGSQTQTPVNAVSTPVGGGYVVTPIFINATAAAITVTATAGTANQLFVSADIQSV